MGSSNRMMLFRHIQCRVSHLRSRRTSVLLLGDRIRGTLGDFDPLNKVPFQRARTRVQKCPL